MNHQELSKATNPANGSITLVGIGGAGVNIVNYISAKGHLPIDRYIAIDTDATSLVKSEVDINLAIGQQIAGMGTMADPEKGRKAAEESRAEIETALRGTSMVLLVAGLGGGTGTGASQVVAEIVKKLGIPIYNYVTTPFTFEGSRRAERAADALELLRPMSKEVFVFSNEALLANANKELTTRDAFNLTNASIMDEIKTILTK